MRHLVGVTKRILLPLRAKVNTPNSAKHYTDKKRPEIIRLGALVFFVYDNWLIGILFVIVECCLFDLVLIIAGKRRFQFVILRLLRFPRFEIFDSQRLRQ